MPFNNSCTPKTDLFSSLERERNRFPEHHVKKTLPPTLSGFGDKAEIKYYIKATVVRPQFYKENIRGVCFARLLAFSE